MARVAGGGWAILRAVPQVKRSRGALSADQMGALNSQLSTLKKIIMKNVDQMKSLLHVASQQKVIAITNSRF